LSLNCDFEDDEPNDKIQDNKMLGLDFFWSKLVDHFDIMWKGNESCGHRDLGHIHHI
jgi:hypothetical protein